jgi:hypothetical protein
LASHLFSPSFEATQPKGAERRLNHATKRPPHGSATDAAGEFNFTKRRPTMAENPEKPKPKLEVVSEQELDEDEREFDRMRRDLPGVKGASAVGIVTIGVSKIPGKNEFFRTHPHFRPVIPLVNVEVGMEQQYFAVSDDMIQALAGIGITVSDHTLYLTLTAAGSVRIIPIHCTSDNEFNRTKELGLIAAITGWHRLYTDLPNGCYRVYPAPTTRYADPVWPELRPAKIFKLAFRDKGRLLDSTEHPLFQKWAARDRS